MKISVKANQEVIAAAVQSAASVATPKTVIVQISDLEKRLGTLMMRAGRNEGHIENDLRPKIRDGVNLPAIKVVRLPDGRMLLCDGFHRTEAFTREGILGIEAEVVNGSEEDAFELAMAANYDHGLPLSDEDKAHKLQIAVSRWSEDLKSGQLSYQELAKRTRLSLTFVHKHVSAMGISPDDVRWVKRGDSVYPMKVEKIGKKEPKTTAKSSKKASEGVVIHLSNEMAQALRYVALEMVESELRAALLRQLGE